MSTDLLVINDIMIRVSQEARIHEDEKNRRADKRYPVPAAVQWGHRDPESGEFEKQAEAWA